MVTIFQSIAMLLGNIQYAALRHGAVLYMCNNWNSF